MEFEWVIAIEQHTGLKTALLEASYAEFIRPLSRRVWISAWDSVVSAAYDEAVAELERQIYVVR